VVDLTHEYLNYQDVHDVTDGGYDEQYMPEQQHIPDDDDIAATVVPEVLLLDPPFPGGPETLSLLHSYVRHVALPLWYNSDNVSIIFYMFNYFLYMCVFFNYYINFYMCFFKFFSLCLIMI